jgi:hypothetical protein
VKGVFTWLWQDNNLVMGIFSPFLLFFSFSLIFSYFFALYLTIYILDIIIGHVPTEEITRNRKRLKKTSTNSIIVREVFDGQHRKELEIPLFIDCYNYHMNLVDVTN